MTPLHPATRRWLAHLQMVRARHFLAAGLSPEEAAEEGTGFVRELERDLADGALVDMGENVISPRLDAGATLAEASCPQSKKWKQGRLV